MSWDWQVFCEDTITQEVGQSCFGKNGDITYLDWMMSAWGWTVAVALLSLVIALVLGAVIGTLRTLPDRPWIVRLGNAWVELFRNIPLLVQVFIWYHVIPAMVPAMKSLPGFVLVVFAIGFFTSARIAEQVRSGIQALPRGQRYAGMAVGFTTFQTYRYVLLPMAFRIILPPLTSEFMNVIKNSAVALTIGLVELTARARSMQEFSFQVFEAFTAATILYLLINAVVVLGMRWVESRVTVPGYVGKSASANH